MHSEERHKLQENVLARELNTWGDKLRPYTSVILGVFAALLVVYIVASMWNSYRETRDRAAWDDYQLAVFQDDYEHKQLQRLAVSEDHEGADMQEWAMIDWADRQLRRAAELYFVNRDESNDRVTDIIGIYEGLAENSAHPEVRNRAQLGLARAFEIKNDLKQARLHYQRIEGALSTIAQQRLKQLESKDVEATANWLATVELPKPSTPTGPGTPGSRPGFEAAAPATDPIVGGEASSSPMSEIFGGLETGDPSRYETPGDDAAATDEPAAESASGTDAASAASAPTEESAPAAEQPAQGEAADEAAAPESEPADDAEQPATTAPTEQ